MFIAEDQDPLEIYFYFEKYFRNVSEVLI